MSAALEESEVLRGRGRHHRHAVVPGRADGRGADARPDLVLDAEALRPAIEALLVLLSDRALRCCVGAPVTASPSRGTSPTRATPTPRSRARQAVARPCRSPRTPLRRDPGRRPRPARVRHDPRDHIPERRRPVGRRSARARSLAFSAYLLFLQLAVIDAVCDCLVSDAIVTTLVPFTLLRLSAAGRARLGSSPHPDRGSCRWQRPPQPDDSENRPRRYRCPAA